MGIQKGSFLELVETGPNIEESVLSYLESFPEPVLSHCQSWYVDLKSAVQLQYRLFSNLLISRTTITLSVLDLVEEKSHWNYSTGNNTVYAELPLV